MSGIPTISIITPVWNGLPYIRECVDSVLTQEFKDWELIISDNGSSDGTRDYLDTLSDPRIRVFKQDRNLGIDGNLNFLIGKIQAPLAYCLCADDYFYGDGLGLAIREWTKVSPETAFIGFNWKEVQTHDRTAAYSYQILPKTLDPSMSQLAFFLFGNLVGNLSNVSFRVDTLKSSGGFDERLRMAGDFEIWARLAKSHTMALSDTETVYVRRHEGTATNYLSKQGLLFGEHIAIYEKLMNEISDQRIKEKLINYFNIQICSYHLRESLKALVYGRFSNLKMYVNFKSTLFWPKWKRLALCLPYALYETGRERMLLSMVRQIINLPTEEHK